MPDWGHFVKTYCLEPDHLPNPHGPSIVVIESVDTEYYTDAKQQPQVRHRLWLAGWDVPLRLNNTRIKILESILGLRTEDAIGRKIALLVGVQNNYGEPKACILIHPFAPQADAPVTMVPSRIATRNAIRLQAAATYGVPIERAGFQITGAPIPHAGQATAGGSGGHRGGGALPAAAGAGVVGGGGGGGIRPSGTPLGAAGAAELILVLRERGWTWERLVTHLQNHAMGDLVAAQLPPECDSALRGPAWALLKHLPITVAVNREVDLPRLIAGWQPPPAPPAPPTPPRAAPARQEVVDRGTGEVIPNAEIPTDDIPF